MIRATLRAACGLIFLIGLLWAYTLIYGGPMTPFFAWLTQYLPPEMHLNVTPAGLGGE